MTSATSRCPSRRRGFTLVELLVTITLMLLIMTIIVKVFQESTTAMTSARTDQDLALVMRRLDAQIRQDLSGATARFTPPLNPQNGLGYFEYSENMFADGQGEDTDDSISFTAKAPAGQPFTGQIMLQKGFWPGPGNRPRFAPTVITSEHAEIIYFLRHGSLYRRVLLIVPDRDLRSTIDAIGVPGDVVYRYPLGGYDLDGDNIVDISWQGGNDLSTRPPLARTGATESIENLTPIPNTLGDLTNRENRAFRPRFTNDHFTTNGSAAPLPRPDGVADDFNDRGGSVFLGDGVVDYWPTLYPGVPPAQLNSPGYYAQRKNLDTLAFPFIFPQRYSRSYTSSATRDVFTNPGGIHGGPLTSAGTLNHSPLDLGDNLAVPSSPPTDYWTYFGFPTWRETRSPIYDAATRRVNDPAGFGQGYSLSRFRFLLAGFNEFLPIIPHWYSDGYGRSPELYYPSDTNPLFPKPVPPPNRYFAADWALNYAPAEEDLIATNVRSFDIKAFDPEIVRYYGTPADINGDGTPDLTPFTPRYVDLGYAAQFKLPANGFTFDGEPTWGTAPAEAATFGHEGRIPPLFNATPAQSDNRIDPQSFGIFGRVDPIGDYDESVVRMRRTWDSWSTDYAFAPLNGLDFNATPPGLPTGPPYGGAPPSGRPVYPSYPAPYPSPLYGIQIQIRIADPENQHLKLLTIRQDFTGKL